MQKLIFGDSGSVPFSYGRNLKGLLGKFVSLNTRIYSPFKSVLFHHSSYRTLVHVDPQNKKMLAMPSVSLTVTVG